MEFEFDKEMDALLRQATRTGETSGEAALSSHIDADEISVFAENALSEKAKPRVIKHLADCDRCRLILSNTIILNAEADEHAASLVIDGSSKELAIVLTVPWYKKLFGAQNLAYGLGAMAIIFAGMLGFLVVQNSLKSGNSEMAKVSENDISSSNVASPAESSDLAAQDLANSNVATNEDAGEGDRVELKERQSGSVLEEPAKDDDGKPLNGPSADGDVDLKDKSETTLKGNRGNKRVDNVSTGQDKLKNKSDEIAAEESEDDRKSVAEKNKPKVAPGRILKSTPAPPPAKPAAVAPSDAKKRVSRLPKNNRSKAREAKKKSSERRDRNTEPSVGAASNADGYASTGTRRIGGKKFTRKNRVWYDSDYKGQKTTNVRRNTTTYKNLDSGLRSITDNLSGTVVVVWKSKAYRVD